MIQIITNIIEWINTKIHSIAAITSLLCFLFLYLNDKYDLTNEKCECKFKKESSTQAYKEWSKSQINRKLNEQYLQECKEEHQKVKLIIKNCLKPKSRSLKGAHNFYSRNFLINRNNSRPKYLKLSFTKKKTI
jgi:hypothetical protein